MTRKTNDSPKLELFGIRHIDRLSCLSNLTDDQRFELKVVAHVLPFRTNRYVIDELIDWDRVPDDPMYQLTFPQTRMLSAHHFSAVADALLNDDPKDTLDKLVRQIRNDLTPHPAGQLSLNVPKLEGEVVPGIQHKYRETCLVFPSNGQTCHAYCTFCFRWPQFVGVDEWKLATDEARRFADYIRVHKEITDILFTGGDPMIMSARALRAYVEPFLKPGFEHIRSIRIGSKALSYWPYRFVTDKDADDVLRLFEEVVESKKQLAFMAHLNHWVELSTDIAKEAVRRVRSTGAIIRSQAPLLAHINDDPKIWSRMWQEQVEEGVYPYYMFLPRDTGAQQYFAVPLSRALEIYRGATQSVSGLARTARGPSMSATPGKICVEGVSEVSGEKVFVLSFLQAREPTWTKRPFFAKFDPTAGWIDDLQPAFGKSEFFYEAGLRAMSSRPGRLLVLPRREPIKEDERLAPPS